MDQISDTICTLCLKNMGLGFAFKINNVNAICAYCSNKKICAILFRNMNKSIHCYDEYIYSIIGKDMIPYFKQTRNEYLCRTEIGPNFVFIKNKFTDFFPKDLFLFIYKLMLSDIKIKSKLSKYNLFE